jgi:outer membrane protein
MYVPIVKPIGSHSTIPMKTAALTLVAVFLTLLSTGKALFAQEATSSAQNDTLPVLTLDQAVKMAMDNNRLVKEARLEAEKYDFRVHTIRTRRRPEFHLSVLEGELMTPPEATFRKGVFGTYPTIGPVPGVDTKVKTPATLSTFALAFVNQPLTQQYKIGLGIRAQEIGQAIAKEDVRAERQKIAAEVRSAYVSLVATETGVLAERKAVETLREAKATAERYFAQHAILKAELLQVDARLAKEEYQLSLAENGLATQSEHLNQLLGRNVLTAFRTEAVPEENQAGLTLAEARQRAIENRPEVRQAHLKEQQAEYGRRIAKAAYIPDVSFSVFYLGIHSIDVVPTTTAAAGVYLSWEPFDWGRRRDEVEEAKKTLQQANIGISEIESQIAVEVGMRYRAWNEKLLLLRAKRAAQEAAREELRVTSNRFKENATLLKDFLQAQAQSAGADYQYQESLSQYWSALADLHKAMGEE